MKKWALLLILLAALIQPAAGQNGQVTVYLPLVLSTGTGCDGMSDWKIIIPESTVNRALNPSAEISGNFAALGSATATRSSSYSKWGLYAFRVQTSADNEGISLTLSALANATHYVTLRVRGTLPTSWDWSLDNSNYSAPTALETLDANWTLYGLSFPAGQANGSTTLYIRQNGSGSGDFYLDGVQVEEKDHWTTYCDGDQEGCEWNGSEHGSASQRSAQSRAGGRVRDLLTDFDFAVSHAMGTGAAAQRLGIDEYALLPGGELNSIKTPPRRFTLIGILKNSSWASRSDLYAARAELTAALAPDAYPKTAEGYQPVRLRFTGGATQKEIAAHYEGGLEAQIGPENILFEKVSLRFLAEAPHWQEIGYSAAALDSNDTATVRTITARLRSTGQWDALGPPNAAGTYSNVLAIAEDATYVYIGGSFTNWDNIANADYIARYNKTTGAWSAMGTGMNGQVMAIAIGPDGTVYAGGAFSTAGGGAASRIAAWNGSSWAALGSGLGNICRAIVFDHDGNLYAGGTFTTAGGGAANYIAKWDGSSWSALGTGMNTTVYALAVGLDGKLYAGGDFTTAGGTTVNYVAEWDGSSWSALGAGPGLDLSVYALAAGPGGEIYAGGAFTRIYGGTLGTLNRMAKWNGTSWEALGTGVDAAVQEMIVGPDGILYASGDFTEAGGITLADRVAKWNGASWSHLDIDLPGSPMAWAMMAGPSDPIIVNNYDLWIGFTTTGTAEFAGSATITNDGTAAAYPLIVVSRSGGTSATLESIRNETTGKELLFSYSLQDGETLYIDLTPTKKSITSSFYGPRPDAILANSDFGEWALQPGDNNVTCLVNEAGGPTVTAYMVWRDAFKSND